ncbi:MAG TPA: 50S ribosome-binding GTPase [Pirellulaceae bacterium]|nr:50S ribosome-binding GTPase [Pirellulaceae bacterium]HMO93952.1 50S ribosome-binding GTPase [Pirellulaceae bacterium]HMP67958.1 50S ribosome-binding GTPase [Pirellulaceae bacterium]
MLKEIPKHKGTDRLQADLKQKISKLKKEVSEGKKSTGRKGHKIPRQGAGRVIIIGGPNAGKSQLLASLTSAEPTIADYPFTTIQAQPGMMPWNDVLVQLIDTPPITADVYDPNTQSLIRGADLVLLLCDLGSDDGGQHLKELLDQINHTKTRLGKETHVDEEDFSITYTKTFFLPNKSDLADAKDRLDFFREYVEVDFDTYLISAQEKIGLEELRDAIYQSLNVIRVYTKTPNQKPSECGAPYTLKQGETVLDLAELIHRDLAKTFKLAKVWGVAVHDGTPVKADYVCHEGDVIEIHASS